MEKNKLYFPLFVDLSEKKVLVVGAGRIATRRIHTLVPFCNNLLVVAPEISMEIEKEPVELCKRKFQPEDIDGADMVLAATDDEVVNHEIYQICKEKGIPVNVSSNHKECDFYFPGIVRKGALVAGVTASGTDHKKAKAFREKIEAALAEGEESI